MKRSKIFSTLIRVLRPKWTFCTDILNNPKKLHSAFEDAGLEFVGMGLYSVVVAHPSNPGKVYKVSTDKNDGFREYARFCKQNEGTRHLPKIYKIVTFGTFEFYELDRLYSIVEPCFDYEEFINPRVGGLYSFAHAGQYSKNGDGLTGNNEENNIYKLSMLISDKFSKEYYCDIHTENVMVDSNGEVFITDPIGGLLHNDD